MKKVFSQFLLKGAVVGIIIFILPLWVLISALILITSGWPIIFAQKRVGINGKVFTLYKFRTMAKGAHKLQKHYSNQNQADGPVFKIYDDPRFTKVGKFLSHTGLDELPQLYNILRGDIAIIGPRPLPVTEAKKLKSWQRERQVITPGIISPWILDGYHSRSFNEWMRSDLDYIKNRSLSYDVYLFLRSTFLIIKLLIKETSALFFTLINKATHQKHG